MAFNPDAYLKKVQGGFDPDAYIKKAGIEVAPAEAPGYLESLLRGGAQGLTFNSAPAITGAVESIPEALAVASGQKSPQELMAAYNKAREASLAQYKAADEANPKMSLAGNLIGGAPLMLAAPELEGLSALKAGASLGAGYGALTGVGQSLSEGQGLADSAKTVASQGLVGGITGGALGKLASKLTPEMFDAIAAKQAVKASGAPKSEIKKLLKQGKLQEYGTSLLEKGPMQEEPLITSFTSPEDLVSKSEDLVEKSGGVIGDTLKQLDTEAAKNPALKESFFNPKDAISKVQELQKQYTKDGKITSVGESAYNKLQDAIDTISMYGDSPIDFTEAQKLKDLIKSSAFDKKGNVISEPLADVYGVIGNEMQNATDVAANKLSNPELGKTYQEAKEAYGLGKQANASAISKEAQNIKNKTFGLTDTMVGVGEGLAKGPTEGVAAAGLSKTLGQYGSNISAVASKKTADTMRSINSQLVKTPEALKSMGTKLVNSGDEIGQKLGNVLLQASEKDDVGRNAMVFSLMQNDVYRNLLKGFMPGSENP